MTFDLRKRVIRGLPGRGQVAGGENKSTVALYADLKMEKKTKQTNVKIMDKIEFTRKKEIQLC